jgi:hypothetical protein
MKTFKSIFFTICFFISAISFSQTTHEFSVEGEMPHMDPPIDLVVQVGDDIKIFNNLCNGCSMSVMRFDNIYPNGTGIGGGIDIFLGTRILPHAANPEDYIIKSTDSEFTIKVSSNGFRYMTINVTVQTNTANINSNTEVNQLNVYPNPFTDYINISGNVETWSLFDFNGKLIEKDSPNMSDITINVSHIKPGSYILLINNRKKFTIIK